MSWCVLWYLLGVGYPECWANERANPAPGYLCSHIDDAFGYQPECHALLGPDCPSGMTANSRGECILVEYDTQCDDIYVERCCYDVDGAEVTCGEVL